MKTEDKKKISPVTESALEDVLHQLLDEAKKQGADNADVVGAQASGSLVSVRAGQVESSESSHSFRLSLRAMVGKRVACVTSNQIPPTQEKRVLWVQKALSAARCVPEDPAFCLASPRQFVHNPDVFSADQSIVSPEEMYQKALLAEEAALKNPLVCASEGAEFSMSHGHTCFLTSQGFSGKAHSASYGLGVSVLAEPATGGPLEKRQRDGHGESAARLCDLSLAQDIGTEAGENAVRCLNPQSIKTGAYPVFFENKLVPTFLQSFFQGISGAAVVKGTTFLREFLGKEVFSSDIHITDDPTRPYTFGQTCFDGEGLPVRRQKIVENGVLNTWLLNLRTAGILGISPTGHATLPFGGAASIAPHYIALAPGNESLKTLMNDVTEGLFVTDIMGGTGVNILTGDYSVGARGLWIQKGQFSHAAANITLAGRLQDVFKTLTPGNDLKTTASYSTPSLRAEGFMISGF